MMLEEVFIGQEARQYTREFKFEALKLVTEGGLSVAQTARDLGVSQSVLHRWKRQLPSDPVHAFPGIGHLKPEAEELRRLRLENTRLRQERDILDTT
jgi:transposase